MSVVINASTTSGLVMTSDLSGTLSLQSNGTTQTTVDSNGLTATAIIPSGSTTPTNGTFLPAANSLGFSTASTERMRITSGGIISQNGNFTSTQGSLALRNPGASVTAGKYHQVGPTGDADPYFVIYNQSSTGVYISPNGTSWNSSSDETVKENLVPITDALSKINTLRAVIGNYITDETKTRHPFLIAQDVQKVLPEAVNIGPAGTLGLQYQDIIPLLVASVKEQQTLIESLTTRLTALEAK